MVIKYCPESHRMWDEETDLTRDQNYTYNFTSSGFFTLIDKKNLPLYNQAFPLFIKATSHIIWCLLWTISFLGLRLFFNLPPLLTWVFAAILLFHAGFFLFRLTQLILYRGLQPILSPPRWIKVTRKLQKGAGLKYLEEQNLDLHPGLLANLALIESLNGHVDAAKDAISRAIALCPNHVALKKLYHHLASNNFTLTNSCDLT